jgi:hypothetical protein
MVLVDLAVMAVKEKDKLFLYFRSACLAQTPIEYIMI